ncbi:alpha/beta fold hydrolase [Evansella clarkii]|jgi:pimeloyl-ACP methyl ester carboxylesterase|uniref:alpha/beta fold hydrolase n=1 Tax=Evansella clarkii TaxID=79879 RepID=UPI0009969993|nr:alpha/beta hydrolase [Evansella clarkii]
MLGFKKILLNESADWAVLLHGFGGDCNVFHKQMAELSSRFNIVLIDLPGHGSSEGLDMNKYHAMEVAEKVIEVLDKLHLPKVHIVAFSLGTIVANGVIGLAPERIKSVVLLGPVLGWKRWSRFLIKVSYKLRNLAPYMVFYKIFANILMPKKNHAKSRYYFIREATKLGRKEFMSWVHLIKRPETPFLTTKKIKQSIPKQYIIGAEDHMFLDAAIQDARADKMTEIEILDNTGHVCVLENSKGTNEAMVKFLDKQISESEKKKIAG